MTKSDPWFVRERAVAFASLVLTNHNEVKIRSHAGTDMALDLLVEILKDGRSTLRFFGVQLLGYIDLPGFQDLDKRILSHRSKDPLEAALPVCVFAIGVRKPDGFYRWIVQPVVDGGRALLQRDAEATWQPLDDAGVDRLIGQVNAWYDALNGVSPPKARVGKAKP
jgi:hypothetical protein